MANDHTCMAVLDQLRELVQRQQELLANGGFKGIAATSATFRKLMAQLERFAPLDGDCLARLDAIKAMQQHICMNLAVQKQEAAAKLAKISKGNRLLRAYKG